MKPNDPSPLRVRVTYEYDEIYYIVWYCLMWPSGL